MKLTHYKPVYPKKGETRVVKQFLWFPKKLKMKDLSDPSVDAQTRWLEYAYIKQGYFTEYALSHSNRDGWVDESWAEDEIEKAIDDL